MIIAWGIYFGLLTGVIIWFVYKLFFALTRFKIDRNNLKTIDSKSLPSVSVCIPARNETHAMIDCLDRLLAVNYPKLEIIVFDDDSGDNTSALIKSYAHAGVRFVEGSGLPTGWLGKNHALSDLAKEASGKYILYADVDTLFSSNTVSDLVDYLVSKDVDMVSILPRRSDGWRFSVLFTTLRYFREVITHRTKAPASASNAWIINKRVLTESFGGFENCKNNVQPEAYFAAHLAAENKYRFLIGDAELGLNYEKKWQSQIDTGIRIYYPLFASNIINSLFAVLFTLLIASPAWVFVASLLFSSSLTLQILLLAAALVFSLIYATFLSKTWSKAWWLGGLLWPVIALQEAVLIFRSMLRHLQRRVTWKGRPILSEKRAVEY